MTKHVCPLPFRKSRVMKALASKRRRLPEYGTCGYWFFRSMVLATKRIRA
jgi:hypothetical protein